VRAIERELLNASAPRWRTRERWLVLNKTDLLPLAEMRAGLRRHHRAPRRGEGPAFRISALAADGTEALCARMMTHIEEQRRREEDDPELAAAEQELQRRMQVEARERIAALAEARRLARKGSTEAGDDAAGDDDEFDVEVEYRA
jgi:GTP-binding protein